MASLVDSIAFRNLQYAISIVLTLVPFLLAFLYFRDARYYAKSGGLIVHFIKIYCIIVPISIQGADRDWGHPSLLLYWATVYLNCFSLSD